MSLLLNIAAPPTIGLLPCAKAVDAVATVIVAATSISITKFFFIFFLLSLS
jgi:hypothetical protein